jgi:glutamate carboxypeptidase
MRELLAWCEARAGWMLDATVALASIESPSDDKLAVDRCGSALADLLRGQGGRVQVLPRTSAGDHLLAEFGCGDRQVLLLGHFDTVWDVGTLERMPVVLRDGRLYGPGVYDMKAGLVIGIAAARALTETARPGHRVVMLCTSDEETGSHSSRGAIEEEARRSDAVLVLEPALSSGALKTSRKGVGVFTLDVEGVAAHAGVDPGRGASAIDELARQVLAVRALQAPDRGLTVNVGVVGGGTRSNVVAARAHAEIDVRVARASDAVAVEQALRALSPHDPRTRVTVAGGFNRPPFERTAAVAALYEVALAAGRALGMDVQEGATGGASDGNFTGALGVPTLDGLGATGDGAHAADEHVIVEDLPRRAALVAAIVTALGGERWNQPPLGGTQ